MFLKTHHRIMAAFVAHAMITGTVYARLPEIQLRLELSEAVFGKVLMAMPVSILLTSLTVPRLIEKQGPRALLMAGLPALGLLGLPLGMAPNALVLVFCLAGFGILFAVANLAINVEADRYEAATEARILNRCHGWWAVGLLTVSVLSVWMIRIGVSPTQQFLLMACVVGVGAPLLLRALPVSQPRTSSGKPARKFAIPRLPVLMVGLFATAGVVYEGVTRSWGIIYLREAHHAAEWIAALALPSVVATQTLGRFLGDGLVARFGPVAVARTLSGLLMIGGAMIAFAPTPLIALVGLAFAGLGFSIVQPQAFGAAARLGDAPASENMAAFSTYTVMISALAPPIFGMLFEALGYRVTFALLLPLPVLAIMLANRLAPSGDAPETKA